MFDQADSYTSGVHQ
ncbi:hypothetical protein HaLaN_32299, partial [Haematococcus lacustris]